MNWNRENRKDPLRWIGGMNQMFILIMWKPSEPKDAIFEYIAVEYNICDLYKSYDSLLPSDVLSELDPCKLGLPFSCHRQVVDGI